MNLDTALTKAFGEPTPKQKEFYEAKTRYVGYGGAKGGGKSHGVRVQSTLLALGHPGIKILVIRKAVSDLRRNYIRPLQLAYALFPEETRPRYSESERMFYFPNGATIEMGYCDIDADADRYRGNEWDVLFLDEATELSEYQYGVLNSCVRGVNDLPKRTYLTCNPGGVGHDNIRRLFIVKEHRRSERPKDYTFIQARVWDNIPLMMSDEGFRRALATYKRKHKPKVIDETVMKACMYSSDYVRALDNLPGRIREAHLEGNWDIFSGQYFSEWNPDVHVVPEFDIPAHWRRTAAIDYGLDRFAVLWFAVDEAGKVYCYRNFEASNMQISTAALTLRELSNGENIQMIVAPFDMWNRSQDTGIPKAVTFAEHGVPLVEAGREREAGWLQVKEYLKYEKGDEGIITPPRMVFFDTCRWITEFIPKLQFNVKKPNDVMNEPHEFSHSPDALRYWCSAWQLGTEPKPEKLPDPFGLNKPKTDGWAVTEEYLIGGYA